MIRRALVLLPVLLMAAASIARAQASCAALASLKMPTTTITSATRVPEGPGGPAGPGPAAGRGVVPARCEVRGVIRPTRDSEIKFALWLPAAGWNGNYRQQGNGGWAGSINTAGLAEPVRRGYAAAATDNGHEGGGANWAIGHP